MLALLALSCREAQLGGWFLSRPAVLHETIPEGLLWAKSASIALECIGKGTNTSISSSLDKALLQAGMRAGSSQLARAWIKAGSLLQGPHTAAGMRQQTESVEVVLSISRQLVSATIDEGMHVGSAPELLSRLSVLVSGMASAAQRTGDAGPYSPVLDAISVPLLAIWRRYLVQ